jgi:hypothetical protein
MQLKLLPLTLRNETQLRAIKAEIDTHTAGADQRTLITRLIEASREYPEVWTFFNEAGAWNSVTLDKMAKTLIEMNEQEHKLALENVKEGEAPPVYEPLSYEDAVREAASRLRKQWEDMLSGNLGLGRKLYFVPGQWPVSLEGIRKGAIILRKIIDRAAMRSEDVALIDSELDSDFWLSVEASEVATIINSFREGVG